MEQDSNKKLIELEEKIEKIYISVEKTRKYFLMSLTLTIIFFILPLIGLFFTIPSFLDSYTKTLGL